MSYVLIFTVFFQILFVYFANFLGQKVIKDLRVKLFNNIINFKVDYFKNTPIGRLVTRTVNDIETIASIFSQGLFMIIADLLQMLLVFLNFQKESGLNDFEWTKLYVLNNNPNSE